MDRPISTILLLLAHLLSIGDLNERENEAQLIFELLKTYRVHFFCVDNDYKLLYKTNIFFVQDKYIFAGENCVPYLPPLK